MRNLACLLGHTSVGNGGNYLDGLLVLLDLAHDEVCEKCTDQ